MSLSVTDIAAAIDSHRLSGDTSTRGPDEFMAALRNAQPWRAHAACKGRTELFFVENGKGGNPCHEAYAICAGCPVQEECAVAGANEAHGVWGGLSASARKKQRRLVAA